MELKQVQPKWTIIQNRKVSNAHFLSSIPIFKVLNLHLIAPMYAIKKRVSIIDKTNRYFGVKNDAHS